MTALVWGAPPSTREYDPTCTEPPPEPWVWRSWDQRPDRCHAPGKVRYEERDHALEGLLATVQRLGPDPTWSAYLCPGPRDHYHVGHRRGRWHETLPAQESYSVEEARELLGW